MQEAAQKAVSLTGNRDRDEFNRDEVLVLALTRLLEIVGEAARHVPPDIRDQHPTIPWTRIAGMRNQLIHGYDQVDMNILWDTIRNDLPPLIAQLEPIIASLEE